jgi:hypothetical protein
LNPKVVTPFLLALGLAGCASTAPAAPSRPDAANPLVANLTSPTDIALNWQNRDAGAAGHIVEYANARNGPYTTLQYAPPSQTTYAHEQLMPRTAFYYRLRPYFGPASAPIDVVLPQGPSSDNTSEPQDWANPKAVPVGRPAAASVRTTTTAASAAPTDLKATVMGVEGVKFTWVDHATDEEAYLIEMKLDSSPDYTVLMTVDPNVNSVGVVTLPNEKRASFRVRPIYFGKPSPVAHRTTGGTAD